MEVLGKEQVKRLQWFKEIATEPVEYICGICGTKRKSFKEISDPVNLVCIDCYNIYVKTMLPQGRWALNKITLLDTEFKHMKDAYIHDRYDEEDKKKLEWFLAEYGGKLPPQEKMDALVGKEQALRIRLMYKNRKRAEHAANVAKRGEIDSG